MREKETIRDTVRRTEVEIDDDRYDRVYSGEQVDDGPGLGPEVHRRRPGAPINAEFERSPARIWHCGVRAFFATHLG